MTTPTRQRGAEPSLPVGPSPGGLAAADASSLAVMLSPMPDRVCRACVPSPRRQHNAGRDQYKAGPVDRADALREEQRADQGDQDEVDRDEWISLRQGHLRQQPDPEQRDPEIDDHGQQKKRIERETEKPADRRTGGGNGKSCRSRLEQELTEGKRSRIDQQKSGLD